MDNPSNNTHHINSSGSSSSSSRGGNGSSGRGWDWERPVPVSAAVMAFSLAQPATSSRGPKYCCLASSEDFVVVRIPELGPMFDMKLISSATGDGETICTDCFGSSLPQLAEILEAARCRMHANCTAELISALAFLHTVTIPTQHIEVLVNAVTISGSLGPSQVEQIRVDLAKSLEGNVSNKQNLLSCLLAKLPALSKSSEQASNFNCLRLLSNCLLAVNSEEYDLEYYIHLHSAQASSGPSHRPEPSDKHTIGNFSLSSSCSAVPISYRRSECHEVVVDFCDIQTIVSVQANSKLLADILEALVIMRNSRLRSCYGTKLQTLGGSKAEKEEAVIVQDFLERCHQLLFSVSTCSVDMMPLFWTGIISFMSSVRYLASKNPL
jgi:hypothetical protein